MKKTNFTDRFKRKNSAGIFWMLFFMLPLLAFTSKLNAQCTPACNNGTNISIEGYEVGCIANVTADMVVTTGPGCGSAYRINLKSTMTGPILETVDNANLVVDGNSIANVPYNYIGETMVLEYIDILSGNSCWGWFTFEDKLAPIVTCGADTIPCYVDPTFANIFPDDCSGPVTAHILSMTSEEIPCSDNTNYLRRIFRTYYASDAAGNNSATCTDTILIERPNYDSIAFPNNDTVYCDQPYAKDGNGNPHPSVTGVPTIGADDYLLWPNNLMNVCGLFTDYTDLVYDLGCMTKVMRTWTVVEWYCGDDYDESYTQVIFILDTQAPVLTVPDDFTVSTGPSACTATFTVPAATAIDNCQDDLNWTVTYPGGFKNQNGGFPLTLPVGTHTIVYSVNDGCINNSVDSIQVTVRDDQAPHAICIQFTVASIPNGSDYVRVFASSFDNGSWDNCGPVTLKVARMFSDCNGDNDPQTSRRDYIDFYCCDISPEYVQVRLFVTDQSGNESECMVNLKVQDKTPPTLVCPPTMYVPCGTYYDPSDLGLTFGYVLTDGSARREAVIQTNNNSTPTYVETYLDGYASDNCSVTVTENVSYIFDDCGAGRITRVFQAVDPFGNQVSCTQRIYLYRTPLNLHANDFNAPNDTMIIDGPCVVDNLDPDDLPNSMRPVYLYDQTTTCFNLAYSYRDEVYTQVNDACFKIIRTWTVIDWCWAAEYGIESALDNGLQFVHVIKVKNTIAPVFEPIADLTVCSNDNTCTEEFVNLTNTATDDCTPANLLKYSYKVDLNYSVNGLPTWDRQGSGNNASGIFPLGNHRICFYATDLCGNVTESCMTIQVNNCKKPTPVAHMLVTEIMPSTGTIGLPAWYFDAGSFSACGGSLKFSFSSNVNDTFHVFTCDDIGNNPPASIEFWVTDEWGNQDFVVVTVIVQDNNNVCDDNTTSLIGGTIHTDSELGVPKIQVKAGIMNTTTSNEGAYRFSSVVVGNQYVVKPSSDRNPENGVETGDIIKIQNHILSKKALDSPYKIIAADVTMDNKVTVTDVVAMRRLILGKVDQFPSGQSWRFVDRAFQFPNPANPFNSSFPEEIAVQFNASVNDVDFYGVKLGDVNGNVTLNFNDTEVEVRTNQTLAFVAEDALLTAGVPTQVTFNADNFSAIEGFQMAVETANGVTIQRVGSDDIAINEEHYNLVSDNNARISWNTEEGVISNGTITFTLVADRDMKISDAIRLQANDLKAVGYGTDESTYNVVIAFNEGVKAGVTVFQNSPNPFSDETSIGFELPENLDVTVKIYDITGRVLQQFTREFAKGYNAVEINSNMVDATGVLYYEVSTKYGSDVKKMIRLKN